MSHRFPADPFAHGSQPPLGAAADLCIPAFSESTILGLAAAEQGVQLTINSDNLIAGVGAIGLAVPLECVIDVPRNSVGIFKTIQYSIDEAAGAGRLVLALTSAEITSRRAMRLANSALWLSSIVTQKALGTREFNAFGVHGAVKANLQDNKNRKTAYRLAKRYPVIQHQPLKLT